MDAQKLRLAQTIDTWVQGIVRQSSSDDQADEQILENMQFEVDISQAREVKAPSSEELSILREQCDPQKLIL